MSQIYFDLHFNLTFAAGQCKSFVLSIHSENLIHEQKQTIWMSVSGEFSTSCIGMSGEYAMIKLQPNHGATVPSSGQTCTRIIFLR